MEISHDFDDNFQRCLISTVFDEHGFFSQNKIHVFYGLSKWKVDDVKLLKNQRFGYSNASLP